MREKKGGGTSEGEKRRRGIPVREKATGLDNLLVLTSFFATA